MVELLAADWNHWPDGLDAGGIAEVAARVGVAGLELGVYDTAVELSPARIREWRRLGDAHGVHVRRLLYSMPAERWSTGGMASRSGMDRLLEEIEVLVRIAAGWGIETVGLWPGADGPGADRRSLTRAVSGLAAIAIRSDVRIALEPKPGTALAAPGDVLSLIDDARAEGVGVGVLLDIGHEYAARRDPAVEVANLRNHLLHVHLGDSDGDPDADLPPGRLHPVEPFLAALDAAGYRGAMSPDVYGAVVSRAMTGTDALVETVERVAAFRAARDG